MKKLVIICLLSGILSSMCNQASAITIFAADFKDYGWPDWKYGINQGESYGFEVREHGLQNYYYGMSSWTVWTFHLDIVQDLSLTVTHLTSTSEDPNCPGGGYAPIDILINNADSFDPCSESILIGDYDVAENHGGSHEFQTDTFLIPSSMLQIGTNNITFYTKETTCSEYVMQKMVAEVQGSEGTIFTADFTEPNIISNGIILETDDGLRWNADQAGGPMASWGIPYIFAMEGSFSGDFYLDRVKCLNLTVRHLTSTDYPGCEGGEGAPINILVNCRTPWDPCSEDILVENYDVAEHHDGSHEFQTDTFLIPSSMLQIGKNTIIFSLREACSDYWIQEMSAEEATAGMYGTVVGIDSAGKPSGPLADANVVLSRGTVGINNSTSDDLGYFSFLNIPEGDYTVTVTKPDYWDSSSDIYIERDETLHEVFQMAYKSGSQLPVGYNFLSPDGKHFIGGISGDISFEIAIIWNGSPGYVDFCIGNNCYNADVENLKGQFAKARLTIPAPDIVNNFDKLIIDIVNGEGKHTYLNTRVRFHPLPGIINSWYGDDISWVPSGLGLSYEDGMSWSWELPIKSEEVTFEASIGYNRGLSYDLMSGSFSGSLGGTGGFGLEWPVDDITLLGEGEAGLAILQRYRVVF